MIWKWMRAACLGAGLMAVLCVGLTGSARGEADTAKDNASQAGTAHATGNESWVYDDTLYRLMRYGGDDPDTALRFGYWGSHNPGSQVKTGEYQDLSPSPFYDVDLLRTDGTRTLNLTITGMDQETNAANLNFYRPNVEVNADYQRFPHNYGHENLGEFPGDTPANLQAANSGTDPQNFQKGQFIRQDMNAGEDYAFRVQELKTNFKWRINDDLRVRLDVWGMYKEGERNATAIQECYPCTYSTTNPNAGIVPVQSNGTASPYAAHCHILSQAQHIDWQTTEVKPIIEWNLGPVVIEYSRPMRVFSQNDQDVYRFYRQGSSFNATSEFGLPRYMEYAAVPDSTTQIDQIKISAQLNECNRFYGFLFNGNTKAEADIAGPVVFTSATASTTPVVPDRESNRRFSGMDLRWTNTTIENVTITPYARIVEEDNQAATFLIPYEETRGTNAIEDDPTQITPINYRRTQVGTRVLWRPFGGGFGLGGLAINGCYEYGIIRRRGLEVDTGSDDSPFSSAPLIESDSHSNTFTIGPSVRWSPQLDTYVRYKYYNADSPLFGTNAHEDANYRAFAMNTCLPTSDNMIEFGGTWMPSTALMINGWIALDFQSQDFGRAVAVNEPNKTALPTELNSPAGFNSQSFPFGVNGSYRATEKWSLNGGAAYYTNFIDQNVAFGAGADHALNTYGLLTSLWGFGSRAQVYNLGTTYDVTCKLRLTGQLEYVHGIQSAYQVAADWRLSATDAATLAGVPQYLRQDVDSTRVSAGIDYQVSRRCSTYFRYVLFDYQDSADKARIASSTTPVTGLPLSGTSNMFLGGLTATF
jgi:hypothetical protein